MQLKQTALVPGLNRLQRDTCRVLAMRVKTVNTQPRGETVGLCRRSRQTALGAREGYKYQLWHAWVF